LTSSRRDAILGTFFGPVHLQPARKPMRRLALPLLLSATLPYSPVGAADPGRTSISVDAQLSSYRYEEPGVMSLTGQKLGVAGRITTLQNNNNFVRAEGRLAGGTVDYDSVRTGSDSGEPDYLFEGRILTGHVFERGESDVGWFAGIGYRYLLNDSSGHETHANGITYAGYRRESNYIYVPLGIEVRKPLSGDAALSFEIEYDHLLAGVQKSYLDPVISNQQRSGHGFRGGIDYRFGKSWALGAFANIWRIGESEKVVCQGGTSVCWEPENRTREVGLRVRYSLR
jgi:hypothetical protein